MIVLRKSSDRGHVDHGWLNTYHTFSFASYYDEKWMGFRDLRVINDDRVQASQGFPKHGHRDMEIITYVLEGALEHKDSLGTGSVIRPGDVQRMSAGKGVLHSEYNASDKNPVHLLQIWILPDQEGIPPSYEQKTFAADEKKNKLRLVASKDGREGSVKVSQNVSVYSTALDQGKTIDFSLPAGRYAWVQMAKGQIEINGNSLSTGDGAAISSETKLQLVGKENSELLLFDLA